MACGTERWRGLGVLALGMLLRSGEVMVIEHGNHRTRSRRWPLSLGLGLALGLACGGSAADLMNSTSGDPVEVPPWACVPGETQPCDCEAELTGLQTCAADGSAFGECDCSPSAMSQGPPPTSTGTGSDTGSGSGSGSGSDTAATTMPTSAEDSTTGTEPGSSSGGSTSGGSTSGGSTSGGSTSTG